MPIRNVILDFDGTCTEIPAIANAYSQAYLASFLAQVAAIEPKAWEDAKAAVQSSSPKAGWTLGTTPSAPAAADPFILAGEAAALLVRKAKLKLPLPDLHTPAYENAQAKWRADAAHVFQALVERGIHVVFVSNSKTKKIENRLDDLLTSLPEVRKQILVMGDARKFSIDEPFVDSSIGAERRSAFDALPVADSGLGPGRPVYLRRGSYFAALCRAIGDDASFEETLVCGDIWELDLAMPANLGCAVHLIERQPPFNTYEYERRAIAVLGERGRIGDALSSLLDWFDP